MSAITLHAPDGTVLGSVRLSEGGGIQWAGLSLAPDAEVGPVADALVTTLPGVRAMTDDDRLVEALVARGGVVQRRAHDYEYALADVPAEWATPVLPAGYDLTPTADATELVPAHVAAYPPDHPDHEAGLDHERELGGILGGHILGPFVPAASWVVRRGDVVAGGILVVDRPAFDEMSPRLWVIDLFVSPEETGRGLGRALIQRSVRGAADAGHELVGLVVTDGNPARELYESTDFRLLLSGTNVDLPR